MKPDGQIIFVREYLQTYIARCCGKTASCSGSAEGAARCRAQVDGENAARDPEVADSGRVSNRAGR